ncbi:type IV pilin protein [Massilia sp. Se16.2.3]|nr:type IV pilin protein [Massilia sp. Se16.2.3]
MPGTTCRTNGRGSGCRRGSGRGFSLIELMVVLVILSLLAVVAFPSYSSYVNRARRLEGQVALVDAMQQQEHHHALHHSYVAFSAAAPREGLRWWSGNSALDSAYELDAEACPGSELRDCVLLRARPGTPNVDVRYRDAECGVLTLSSRGEQGADGPGKRCWP